MPGRQSHGGPPSKKVKTRTSKSKKRSQDAFAIALKQNEEKVKLSRNRRGQLEDGGNPRKRVRDEEQDRSDDSEDDAPRKQQKRSEEDEMDVNSGSDSEGNTWRLGEVDRDNDSEIDSDEAFGESDEERFDGYAFTGSTSGPKKPKPSKAKPITLDESADESDDVENSDDESLGEDAIDLATALDQAEEDSEAETNTHVDQDQSNSEEDDEESNGSGAESDTEVSDVSEGDDSRDPEKLSALQGLVANLPLDSHDDTNSRAVGNELGNPSAFGIVSKAKLTLEDLGLASVKDANIRKSIKLLDQDGRRKSATLAVPLAKRQQDMMDRGAAYEKSKETLEKWNATVQHNRRAEHLSFPLRNNDAEAVTSNARLQTVAPSKPFNELEAAIQSIMEESGLAPEHGKDDEDKIREYEELQENKMSMEEVVQRRQELRKARELMFREEAKAKRIKKIKSKSYRKVHRKQREKEDRINQEAMLEAGIGPVEDEIEAHDRRRATARMGDKHRNSKWAKSARETGRTAWDEDARAGVSEMARREEELRKRIEGRAGRSAQESDESSEDSADEESDVDSSRRRILAKLNGINDGQEATGPGSKLANMDFMLRADASKRRENEAMVEELRKELDGNDVESDGDENVDEEIGRRSYGPRSLVRSQASTRSAFEERHGSGSESESNEDVSGGKTEPKPKATPAKSSYAKSLSKTDAHAVDHDTAGAWSKVVPRRNAAEMSDARRAKESRKTSAADVIDIAAASALVTGAAALKPSTAARKPKAGVRFMNDAISDDDDAAASDAAASDAGTTTLPFALRDAALIKRAFAGADVLGDFEAEKRATAAAEDEQVVDQTLPGWGSWVGSGLSRRAAARNKGRFLARTEGIKAADRKDAKLDRVIVNEKRVKKNTKYLASQLPFPFETKQQYERSLRLPVGPEWTTKETFQDATTPRVLIKQGIIRPMEKPLV